MRRPITLRTRPAGPKVWSHPPIPSKPVQLVILALPAQRLRALLDFTRTVNAARLSDAEITKLSDALWTIVARRPTGRDDLAEGLEALRRWFSDLTSQAWAEVMIDRGSLVYVLTEDGDLLREFSGSFATAVVDKAASLLQRIGPHRLRVCPLLLRTGERCARLFIGERHQKYCTPPHAQIQARRESRRRAGAAAK